MFVDYKTNSHLVFCTTPPPPSHLYLPSSPTETNVNTNFTLSLRLSLQCSHMYTESPVCWLEGPFNRTLLKAPWQLKMTICNRGWRRVPSSALIPVICTLLKDVRRRQKLHRYPDADLQLDSSGFRSKIVPTALLSEASWLCAQPHTHIHSISP